MKSSLRQNSVWMAAGIILIIVVWMALSAVYGSLILPSPGETLGALVKLTAGGDVWEKTAVTIMRGLAGFTGAVIIGTPLGFVLGFNRSMEEVFWPALVAMQTTPLISWLLLAMIWFGLTGSLPVFIVFITTLPLIIINAYHGVKSIDFSLVEMSRVFKIKKSTIVSGVYLPQIVPFLLAGFSAALGTTWKAVAMAELFSAQNGIGSGMSVARMNLETAQILAWTIILVVLGLISDKLLMFLSRRKFLYFKKR